jgi:hypothetical protein
MGCPLVDYKALPVIKPIFLLIIPKALYDKVPKLASTAFIPLEN